jgi:nitroreductase/NAD-dependent dihydropyrimidine dehydrogenase PreA subunit
MAGDFFSVDAARCVACGRCAADCSFRALSRDAQGRPVLSAPARCMHCQHCFAVCPTGAVSVDGVRAGQAKPLKDLPLPSAAAVENWLAARRSVRAYAPKDVPRSLLDPILHHLGNVPTGCNARGLTFTCFSTQESMARFRKAFVETIARHRDGTKLLPRWLAAPAIDLRKGKGDLFFRGAPGLLIVSSDETAPGVITPETDVAAACAYFEMLANAHGLATCWCGFLGLVQKAVPEILEETIGLRRTSPFYAMLFGYPAVTYARTVVRGGAAKIVYP